ncbi:MAG TPA: hypothetical protein VNL91_03035 [Thermoanaerobaculia bacterium]|nr:hypothetical protein [Thermoanaerobaculia bacterium]
MQGPLFVAIYFVEAGIFFAIVPWTGLWTMNSLLHSSLALAVWADNPFVRGFVSGLGLAQILIGTRDLIRISREWKRREGGE